MPEDLVSLEVDDDLATVTLDRPEHHNLITHEMMGQLNARLQDVHETDVDLLVVRAAGEHFSPGRDKSEDLSAVPREEVLTQLIETNNLVYEFDGISIAMVQGKALGFGCGLTVQCDLTVAAETASFGYNEIDYGGVPKIVMSYLETYVGRKAAVDLVVTGRDVSAAEAHDMGLATRVVPDDELEAYTDGLVDTLRNLDLAAATECKFYFREVASVEPEDLKAFVIDAML